MSGGSEKKRARQVAEYKDLHTKLFMGLYAFFILYRVVWNWSSFTWGNWLMLALFSGLNYACFFVAVGDIAEGLDKAVPEDVMYVNCFVMFLSAFWESAWLVYLVIPAYAIASKCGCLPGGKAKEPEPVMPMLTPEMQAELDRKKKKKERKAERPKYKAVRGR